MTRMFNKIRQRITGLATGLAMTKARVRAGNMLGVGVHLGKEGGIAIAQTAPVKAKSIVPTAPINRGKVRA